MVHMAPKAAQAVTPISERALPRRQVQEKREIAYYVRAKTGPGNRDWSPIGVAFKRRDGDGYTIKINSLPLPASGWNGSLVLVPPYEEPFAPPEDGSMDNI